MITSVVQDFQCTGQLVITNGATVNTQIPFLFSSSEENKLKKALYATIKSDKSSVSLINFGGDQSIANIKATGFRSEKDAIFIFSAQVEVVALISEMKKGNVTQSGFLICPEANTTVVISLFSRAYLETEA